MKAIVRRETGGPQSGGKRRRRIRAIVFIQFTAGIFETGRVITYHGWQVANCVWLGIEGKAESVVALGSERR